MVFMSQVPKEIEIKHKPQVMLTKIIPGINTAYSFGK
jgi:hypothetical protein